MPNNTNKNIVLEKLIDRDPKDKIFSKIKNMLDSEINSLDLLNNAGFQNYNNEKNSIKIQRKNKIYILGYLNGNKISYTPKIKYITDQMYQNLQTGNIYSIKNKPIIYYRMYHT